MENNLTYSQNGDYLIPNLTLSEPPEAKPLGKYGRMRRNYLEEHRPVLFSSPASEREAVSPPAGDRRDSEPPSRADDAGANEVGGRNGGAEGQRPHEMGGVDEHPESAGGGNPPDGTYLQLTLNLFPSEQEQGSAD